MARSGPARIVYQIFVGAFGGLDGVAAHLAHVAALGAEAVYLTPIFAAPSPHKYDASDFERVDPAFGGEAAFDRLVAACRARSLGLILDGVFNHVGEAHRWLGEHPDWFTGSDWRGFPTLRELDTKSATVRRACCDVVARWTARGATGWRLDCANDLGVPFAGELARAARDGGAVDGVIGEVMGYGAGWARRRRPRRRHELLAARCVAGAGVVGVAGRSAAGRARSARRRSRCALAAAIRGRSSARTTPPRLASALDDDEARIRLALALAFAYPGVPMIYYGDELGHARRRRSRQSPSAAAAVDVGRRDGARSSRRCARCAVPSRRWRAAATCRWRSPAPTSSPSRASPIDPDETLLFVANATPRPLTRTLFVALPLMFDALPLARSAR